MAYLQRHGFRVIPVNPTVEGTSILGETVYGDLASISEPVEMVDIFRKSEAAGEVIDSAIAVRPALGVRSVWLQLGIYAVVEAARAAAAGLDVVIDRCIKIEHNRLGTTRR